MKRDKIKPSLPTNLRATSIGSNEIAIDFNNATDNVAISRYEYYINDVYKTYSLDSIVTLKELTPETTYKISVRAIDNSGNASAFATINANTLPLKDEQAPTPPIDVVGSATETSILLNWKPATDNIAIAGYLITNGAEEIFEAGTSHGFSDLTPGTSYTFKVVSVDTSGIMSEHVLIAVKTKAIEIVTPPVTKTTRIYTTHCMSAFIHHCKDLKGWMLAQQKLGINAIWVHSDNYFDYYITNLARMFVVAEEIGMKLIPGVHGSAWETATMMKDSWGKAAFLKIDGKPVFTAWNYRGEQRTEIAEMLAAAGITKDQYTFIPHSYVPYTWDEGHTWVGGSGVDENGTMWFGAMATHPIPSFGGPLQIRKLFSERPEMDGYMSFGVDYGKSGNDLTPILYANNINNIEAKSLGKYFFAGINGYYASTQYVNYGFEGLAKQWEAILVDPIDQRPIGVCNATTNDYKELSYMDAMINSPVDGLSYIPAKWSGYNLGEMRIPLTDHSGMSLFCKPYSDAFLNDLDKPVFDTDRIFCWYWLHPKDAPVMPDIPQELIDAGLGVDQLWWDNSIYAKDTYARFAILTYMEAGVDNIRMGAHLTAPAYLQINDTRSELLEAGAAWFEIPLADFRGFPVFSIINEDGTIRKTGKGLQPITDRRWPAAFNPLVTEIN